MEGKQDDYHFMTLKEFEEVLSQHENLDVEVQGSLEEISRDKALRYHKVLANLSTLSDDTGFYIEEMGQGLPGPYIKGCKILLVKFVVVSKVQEQHSQFV